jgi:ribitol 2-dehydrogenase
METSLDGKVVIVTGASSGIGRATALAISRQGARVVLAARDREALDLTSKSVKGDYLIVAMDSTQPDDAQKLVDASLHKFGTIDVLVANAGIYVAGDIASGDPDAWDKLIATNVSGPFRLIRAVLPHMLERGTGDIVVTSSVSGHQAIQWEPVYSASKHAVQAFVHGLRRQVGSQGVRVGAIAPGIVLNELWQRTFEDPLDVMLERGDGLASDDVADAIIFMLTRPRHVTVRDLVILPRSQDI